MTSATPMTSRRFRHLPQHHQPDAGGSGWLRQLLSTPRIPISELAPRVGMSAPAVRERIARLEDAGVIARWRVDLDPVALGFPGAPDARQPLE